MDSATQVVDAHYHLWSPESHPWLQDLQPLPEGVEKLDFSRIADAFDAQQHLDLLHQAGLHCIQGVYVQCGWHGDPVGETEWATQAGKKGTAVVGYADVDKPDVLRDQLARHRQHPRFRGVRFMLDWDPERPGLRQTSRSGWMQDPGFVRGLGVLEATRGEVSFDLQICQCQLVEAAQLALRFPSLTFVLNHAGFPLGNARDDGACVHTFVVCTRKALQRCWLNGGRV